MRPPVSILLASLLFTVGATNALAQDAPDASSSTSKAQAKVYTIDFPGGTMADYTALLRKTFPDASIILLPGTKRFAIPKIQASIHDHRAYPAIQAAIELVCGIAGTLVYPATDYNTQQVVEGHLDCGSFGIDQVTYRVEAVRSQQQRAVRSGSGFGGNEQHVQVWPLVDLTDSKITMEEILGTLKVAFELEDSGAPTLRYHEPTTILFVKGTRPQIETVETTLNALTYVANDMKAEEISKSWAKDDEIQKLKKEIQNLKKELHKALGKDSPSDETNKNADSE